MDPVQTGVCHCHALRQAARRATALYDAALAPLGLRVSQFGILARLHRGGPRSIQVLAAEMLLDRTTMGRNIRPLARDGLLRAGPDPLDRRSRLLSITLAGQAVLRRALPEWARAQRGFEAGYGAAETARLHEALDGVVAALRQTELAMPQHAEAAKP